MQKLFSRIKKIRNSQVKKISWLILLDPESKRTVAHTLWIRFMIRRLKRALRKEKNTMLLVGAYYKRDVALLAELKAAAQLEDIKENALLPIKIGSLPLPGAVILIIFMDDIYEWINKYTANYKRFAKLLK